MHSVINAVPEPIGKNTRLGNLWEDMMALFTKARVSLMAGWVVTMHSALSYCRSVSIGRLVWRE